MDANIAQLMNVVIGESGKPLCIVSGKFYPLMNFIVRFVVVQPMVATVKAASQVYGVIQTIFFF